MQMYNVHPCTVSCQQNSVNSLSPYMAQSLISANFKLFCTTFSCTTRIRYSFGSKNRHPNVQIITNIRPIRLTTNVNSSTRVEKIRRVLVRTLQDLFFPKIVRVAGKRLVEFFALDSQPASCKHTRNLKPGLSSTRLSMSCKHSIA